MQIGIVTLIWVLALTGLELEHKVSSGLPVIWYCAD